MIKILSGASQIITVDTHGTNVKRGNDLNDVGLLTGYAVVIEDEIIKDIIPESSVKNYTADEIIDLKDKIILPGLIECHTHAAFAGSRANEFREKLKGTNYEEIDRLGGGINSTVNAVRNSAIDELIKIIFPRVEYFISQGVTTLEIKSGYGLDFENEIKLLKAINYLNDNFPIDIIPTFLGAHTFPREFKTDHDGYIKILTRQLIPYISRNNVNGKLKKLAAFCDGYCELTAFSPEEITKIFSTAKKFNMDIRLHTDQFNSIGGIEAALNLGAVSVDHLEVIKDEDIVKLGTSDIVCVLLPGSSFFLNHKYAPARDLINNNAIVALSTDYNPGSSNISNLNLIMSLAALKMGMTIEETISAVTINAAKALKANQYCGSIEIGKRADLSIFNTGDYADILYNVGKNLTYMTIKNGDVVYISD